MIDKYEPCSICEEYIEGVICNKDKCPVGRMKEMNRKPREAKEQIEVETSKEIHSLHSEIKTQSNALLAYKEELERYQSGVYVKLAKAEAVKEFAERVKLEFYYEFDELIPSIMADKIDNLIKEMVGEG